MSTLNPMGLPIHRSRYRKYLKYYDGVHQFQSESYAQIRVLLELLGSQSASHPAFISRVLRAQLQRLVGRVDALNQFYQASIQSALKWRVCFCLKPITLADAYRVVHEQEQMHDFLRTQYCTMRRLISQLWSQYHYGDDGRVFGAHFLVRLKKLFNLLEDEHQAHQHSLGHLKNALLCSIADQHNSHTKVSFFKRGHKALSGSAPFQALIEHCNRPFQSIPNLQDLHAVRTPGDCKP